MMGITMPNLIVGTIGVLILGIALSLLDTARSQLSCMPADMMPASRSLVMDLSCLCAVLFYRYVHP